MNSVLNSNRVKGLIVLGSTTGLGFLGYRIYKSKYRQPEGIYWESNVNADKFFNAITKAKANNPYGAYVHTYSREEYKKMKLFLLSNGSKKDVAGVAVKVNGDIVSVFKHPDYKVSLIAENFLLPKATENRGTHLDCFNGVLPKLYGRVGFIPVSKTKFNPEFAPEGWNYERDDNPDIIFMKYKPEPPLEKVNSKELTQSIQKKINELPYSDDYEQAQEIQTRSV